MSDGISEKLRVYLRSSLSGLGARVFSKFSAFGSIWLLNRILSKGAYGDYEFALSMLGMVIIVGSGGLEHVAMYRLSRVDAPVEELAGRELAGALLGWSLVVSGLFATIVALGAPLVADATGKPELAFWVSGLSLLIPLRVLTGIYQSWHRARQLVAESLLYGDVAPQILKLVLLGAVWAFWAQPEGVVTAVVVAQGLVVTWWFLRSPVKPFDAGGEISWWDVKYAGKLAVTSGLSNSAKRTDVLMMGALATSGATAEYVVAAKLSFLAVMGHKLMHLILTPRIGRFLEKDQVDNILTEYHQARVLGLLFALGAALVMITTAPWLLAFFGDYRAAVPVLALLLAVHVVNTSFGMCAGYLNIAGHAGWTLVSTASVLLVNVALNIVFIPVLGAVGAATAMLLSFALSNTFIVYLIRRLDGLVIYSLNVGLVAVLAATSLILLTVGVLPRIFAVAGVLAVALLLIWQERSFFQKLTMSVARAVREI